MLSPFQATIFHCCTCCCLLRKRSAAFTHCSRALTKVLFSCSYCRLATMCKDLSYLVKRFGLCEGSNCDHFHFHFSSHCDLAFCKTSQQHI